MPMFALREKKPKSPNKSNKIQKTKLREADLAEFFCVMNMKV